MKKPEHELNENIIGKVEWEEYHKDYSQLIEFHRGDLEDFLDRDITNKEWYYFREKMMDYLSKTVLCVGDEY